MPIHFLDNDKYLGYEESVAESGVENIHIGQIELDRGRVIRTYVKIYPLKEGLREHRGLINELIGYSLAEELGLAVPENAGFITLKPAQIQNPPAWVTGNRSVTAWWIQDAFYPSLKAYYNLSKLRGIPQSVIDRMLDRVKNEILASGQSPSIIAFDDLIANIDRNIGNLLRASKGQYILIDHGRAFGRVDWVAEDLDPSKSFKNVIHDFLRPQSGLLPFKQKVILEAEKQTLYIRHNLNVLLGLTKELLVPQDQDALTYFIRQRSERVEIAQRLGFLI
jgi:hypothetical protein